jgi:hypothetical protein
MSTTGKDRSIEEQLATLLDYNAPAVTIEEVREKAPATTPANRREDRRRVVGLRPALAWMVGLLVLGVLGIGIGVGVGGTTVNKPASVGGSGRLSDHLALDVTRVVAGQSVEGNLVVYNPGKTFNLTKGCQPQLAVGLNRGNFHQTIAFAAVCDTAPLPIDHGTTRLQVRVSTTYDQCRQSGPGTPTFPKCLADGGIPPLPAGTYMAKVVWDGPVALPTPNEVTVTLVAKSHTSVGPPVTTRAVTRIGEFQPWATKTSLAPGIKVIGSLSGGDCWTESLPDYDNQYAWRCMAGNVIYDPCFAAPGSSKVRRVACAPNPTGGVYLMNLTTALPQSSSPRTSGGKYAWYITVSNGESCSRVDGAGPPTIGGVTLDYVCTNGGAAEPNRSASLWTDLYAANDAGPLEAVTVSQAWN